jgi:hypothetical protein
MENKYVPAPCPASSDYYVLCHYYPGWAVHENGYSPFFDIVDFPERTPFLGYYDEANPEVADWEVKWAREHGINCFVYCWYRKKSNVGKPLTDDSLVLAHQIDALKKSRYGHMMDYAIMWEADNAGGASDEGDLVNNLVPFWCREYFSDGNYMKIDGKPLVFVYDFSHHILDAFGSPENMKKALTAASEKAKDFGFEGIIFAIESRHGKEDLELWKACGYDISFAYCWQTEALAPTNEEILDMQMQKMSEHLAYDSSYQILTCSSMWDPYPWYRHNGKKPDEITRWCLTPQNWEKLLNNTKEMLSQIPENAMAKNMIMLDNWNEWCEGHYIAPHEKGGFEYLDAVRRALTKCDNEPDHISPLENGFGPYGENIDLSLRQDWVPYILDKMN